MKNIKQYLPIIISAVIITTICAFTHQQSSNKPTLTIFVHGSKPQLHDVLFKIGQYYFLPGMHHVDEQLPYAGPKSIIHGLRDSEYIDMNHLYFFGWSGRISAEERQRVAVEQLLPALETLIKKYRFDHGITPAIRIITHSHGGNVVLNLVHELEQKKSSIVIDELIILAAPVQSWTKDFIKSNNCKKIYSFYSMGDLIQIADPQGLQVHINNDVVLDKPELFEHSKRTFDHHDKLTQVQIMINHKDPGHIDFIDYLFPLQLRDITHHDFPRFLPELGTIIHAIEEQYVQDHMKKKQKPIKVKIDTTKSYDDNRISVYLPE